MTDEQQQPSPEVTQAVADSNASTSASLSTAVAQDSAAPASLSTSVSTGQEAAGTPGEFSVSAGPATAAEAALPATGSFTAIAETAAIDTSGTSDRSTTLSPEVSGDAPAVAQPGEPIGSTSPDSGGVAPNQAAPSFSNHGLPSSLDSLPGAASSSDDAVESTEAPAAALVTVEHSRVMSALIRAKAHLEALDAGIVRNAYAAIEEIEAIFREAKGG